jgi:hypothetical protein
MFVLAFLISSLYLKVNYIKNIIASVKILNEDLIVLPAYTYSDPCEFDY